MRGIYGLTRSAQPVNSNLFKPLKCCFVEWTDNGGEVYDNERAEESWIQEGCQGRVSYLSFYRIWEEKVIWHGNHGQNYVHGRETSCHFLILSTSLIFVWNKKNSAEKVFFNECQHGGKVLRITMLTFIKLWGIYPHVSDSTPTLGLHISIGPHYI